MTSGTPSYEHILFEEDGDTARVSLDRPEVRKP